MKHIIQFKFSYKRCLFLQHFVKQENTCLERKNDPKIASVCFQQRNENNQNDANVESLNAELQFGNGNESKIETLMDT